VDFSNKRKTYNRSHLSKSDLNQNPFIQFDSWMKEAIAADISEPYAMSLATSNSANSPSIRTVLLRFYNEEGMIFYTNYSSQKGRELKENPKAALLFFWPNLEKQIRIQGAVQKVDVQTSDNYWDRRPELSRKAAIASPQSEVISSSDELIENMRSLEESKDLSRPEHWGGYILKPEKFEFWQGRPGRMHDRFRYLKTDSASWQIDRIAP